uniref:Uncharacterized protein n=1 Tax=Anguilla anguilla TaxID=7936 RepID=A0A0E9VP49_ANGAN
MLAEIESLLLMRSNKNSPGSRPMMAS